MVKINADDLISIYIGVLYVVSIRSAEQLPMYESASGYSLIAIQLCGLMSTFE